jgi:hypothetical protein
MDLGLESSHAALAGQAVVEFLCDGHVRLRGEGAPVSLERAAYAALVRTRPTNGGDAAPANVALVAVEDDLVEAAVPIALGPYRIVDWIGRGSFGDVFEAIEAETGELCALKRLRQADAVGLQSFKQEVRSLAALSHPCLVLPYELMAVDDTWFFTMERVHGPSLLEFVWGQTSYPGYHADVDRRLRDALAQLAETIQVLHARGLLHLDLKPANILVRGDGRVALLDFGLAQHLGGRRSELPRFVGAPDYMAPELLMGHGPGDACDWYAVGVMLFQALTGEHPFREGQTTSLARRLYQAAPDVRRLCPDVPDDLAELCAGLLARSPERRLGGAEVTRRVSAGMSEGTAPELRAGTPTPGLVAPIFVGRREVLGALEDAWRRVEPGRPVCVFLRGPSGIGKSAIAHRFVEWSEEQTRRTGAGLTLAGRCYECESFPYKGVDAVIDQLAARIAECDDSLRAEIRGEDLAAAAKLFPVLHDPSYPPLTSRGPQAGEAPADLRQRALRGLRRALTLLARGRPIVLLIDDIHWSDRDSVHLLIELLSPPLAPPVLLLCTCRPDDAATSEFFGEWDQRARQALPFPVLDLSVEPLSNEDTSALAEAWLGPLVSAQHIARITHDAVGSPYVVEELARHARERGGLAGTVAVQEVLRERLGRLGAEARCLLELVVLAGRPIEQSVVLAASGGSGGRHWLTVLRASCLLRGRGARGRDVVETYHHRIRETVLAEISSETARTLHRSLAETLETRGAELHELAHHWFGAGALARAAECARGAAVHAATAMAFDRAAELYSQARAWGRYSVAELAELMVREAECLFNAGRNREAAAIFMAAASRTPAGRRALQGRAVEAWLLAGQIDEGLRVLRPLLRHYGLGIPSSTRWTNLVVLKNLVATQLFDETPGSPPTGDEATEAAACVDLCWSAGKGLVFLQPMQGTLFMLQSLRRAQRAGERWRAARVSAYMAAGLFLQIRPLRRLGARHLARAQHLGRSLADPYLIGACKLWQAMSEVYPGRWRAMFVAADEATDKLRRDCVGVRWECVVADGLATWALQFLGEIEASGARAAEHLNDAVRHGDLYAQVLFMQYLAYANLAAGDIAVARQRTAWLVDAWTRESYTIPHMYAMLIDALCDLYEGRPEAARQRYCEHLPRIRASGGLRVPMLRIDFSLLEARIGLQLMASKQSTRGLRPVTLIAASLAREARCDGPANAEILHAGLDAVAGRFSHAEAGLTRSAARFRGAEMELHARCAELHRAALRGDAEGVRSASAWMRARGVRDPSRWTAIYSPGHIARDDA